MENVKKQSRRGPVRGLLQGLCAALLLSAAVVTTAQPAEACSCVRPTIESSYNNHSDVVVARVLTRIIRGNERWHLARVRKPYKGCLDEGQTVWLVSAVSSATCGVSLSPGTTYLINGQAAGSALGVRKLSISLCDYNKPVGELTAEEREFLNGRTVTCGNESTCADGSQPVSCFADPCQVTPACREAATCVANYCGGCNAEFYDAGGNAVCQDPAGCQTNADCPSGSWCRQSGPDLQPAVEEARAAQAEGFTLAPRPVPLPEPGRECVPFVGEGQSCGGFVPPWAVQLCAPGLTCDLPNNIPDAPGVCHRPCRSNNDCAARQYCASDGLCADDGQCEQSVDCNVPGNDYLHIACVGRGVCPEFGGQCGWQCGTAPSCDDLRGIDFGPCDRFLGYAVVDGQCRPVSGCDGRGYNFFPTLERCEAQCPTRCDDLTNVKLNPCATAVARYGLINGQCQALSGCAPAGIATFSSLAACEGRCEPSCKDLSGINFGACLAILGVGVVNGQCTTISGCDSQGHALFSSVAECRRECQGGCFSDADCSTGQRCNAAEVCRRPPGCGPIAVPQTGANTSASSGIEMSAGVSIEQVACPAVCFGECVPATECRPGQTTPPDRCGNVCSCTDGGRWVCTERACVAECKQDSDCQVSGCSGEVCAAEPRFTTCIWRDEFACYRQQPPITSCGCKGGFCGWDQTRQLAECIRAAGPTASVISAPNGG
jgi:eight-cysteine-cluster-containing protein